MSSQREEFKHESLQDPHSIVRYLNALADGISKGQLTLGTEAEQFAVRPEGLLKLEIKAKRKSDRVKIEMEIAWTEREIAAPGSGNLVIDTKAE